MDEPASRKHVPEGAFALGPTGLDSTRQRARSARAGALVEVGTAGPKLGTDAFEGHAMTSKPRDLGSVDADCSTPRPDREVVSARLLRGRELELAREEVAAQGGVITAVLPMRPARVDALSIALETTVDRVHEGAGGARGARP